MVEKHWLAPKPQQSPTLLSPALLSPALLSPALLSPALLSPALLSPGLERAQANDYRWSRACTSRSLGNHKSLAKPRRARRRQLAYARSIWKGSRPLLMERGNAW